MRIPVISFFTGGGFLDIGLHQAGFQIVWTNEHNNTFADFYEAAMTGLRRKWADESLLDKVSSRESISRLRHRQIMAAAFPQGRPELFGVVGGPPCPDFSNGGVHAGSEGKNGRLTGVYFRIIRELRPDFFIVENVPGLYLISKHRTYLKSQIALLRKEGGYAIDYAILNALELGVPQNRDRLFVVGFRKRLAFSAVGRPLRRSETGWFPWPKVAKYNGVKSLHWPTATPYGSTPKLPEGIPIELTVYPALSGNGNPERLPNGREYYNSYSRKFRLRAEGDVSAKSFKRLHRYRFSPTAWYGNQEVHLHPWKPRRLSVREALRIQSVPDEYVLPKNQPLSAKFKMISNGVPCAMAREIGNSTIAFLAARHKPRHIEEIALALSSRYGDDRHGNRSNPFEEFLFILCSLQTNEDLYTSTFASLKRAYPRCDMLAKTSCRNIAAVLRIGGLANQKAGTIFKVARVLREKYGRVTLAPLHAKSTNDCEAFLTSLPGIGIKTARCILMYSLGRPVFPVDTHCWRICRRLGWVKATRPDGSCSPQDMDRLQERIPPPLRYGLHVNMISLGRDVCTTANPKCSACVIRHRCHRVGVEGRR